MGINIEAKKHMINTLKVGLSGFNFFDGAK